jgi:hypothetical protein
MPIPEKRAATIFAFSRLRANLLAGRDFINDLTFPALYTPSG